MAVYTSFFFYYSTILILQFDTFMSSSSCFVSRLWSLSSIRSLLLPNIKSQDFPLFYISGWRSYVWFLVKLWSCGRGLTFSQLDSLRLNVITPRTSKKFTLKPKIFYCDISFVFFKYLETRWGWVLPFLIDKCQIKVQRWPITFPLWWSCWSWGCPTPHHEMMTCGFWLIISSLG